MVDSPTVDYRRGLQFATLELLKHLMKSKEYCISKVSILLIGQLNLNCWIGLNIDDVFAKFVVDVNATHSIAVVVRG